MIRLLVVFLFVFGVTDVSASSIRILNKEEKKLIDEFVKSGDPNQCLKNKKVAQIKTQCMFRFVRKTKNYRHCDVFKGLDRVMCYGIVAGVKDDMTKCHETFKEKETVVFCNRYRERNKPSKLSVEK